MTSVQKYQSQRLPFLSASRKLSLIGVLLVVLLSLGCGSGGGGANQVLNTGPSDNSTIDPPSNLKISIGDKLLKVTWGPVRQAVRYKVNILSSYNLDGSFHQNEIEVSENRLEHTGLTNGHEYCYSVIAKSSKNESMPSDWICGRPSYWGSVADKIEANRSHKIGGPSLPSIAVADGNTYAVLYSDPYQEKNLMVKKWDGNNWVQYGLEYSSEYSINTPMINAYNGKLYVAWSEPRDLSRTVYFVAMVSDDTWTILGGGPINELIPSETTYIGGALDFTVDDLGVVYCAFISDRYSTNKKDVGLYVKYVNPLSNKWEDIGGTLNESSSQPLWPSIIVHKKNIYVAWAECAGTGCSSSTFRMKMWEPLSSSWMSIETSNLITAQQVHGIRLMFSPDSSYIFLLFTEGTLTDTWHWESVVAIWNGIYWIRLSPASGIESIEDIAVCSSNVYLAGNFPEKVTNQSHNHIIIYKLEGIEWKAMGGEEDTLNSHIDITASYPDIACDGADLVVGFMENNNYGEYDFLIKALQKTP